ncbi:TetR family transcriptional regulator [Porticoccaceae bacterium]|nr:TetR family transcriptional regulator [Porticoccaceae bacterium]
MTTPLNSSTADLTKLRLIHAAISLFSKKGIDGVSLRMINREAGALNNSALHYHFGNKMGVIEASIDYIQQWFEGAREMPLARLEKDSQSSPAAIEDIVNVLMDPYIKLLESESWGYDAICALARFEFDGDEAIHTILNRSAGKAARRLKKLLAKSCPHLPQKMLDHRLNLCLLIAIQGFTDSKNLRHSYLGKLTDRYKAPEDIGRQFKSFCVAGLSAPIPE